MKKKILMLIIILLIISPSFVYAKVVYGEYQEFIMNTDKYMEETDTLKREEVRLYNTYEIKRVDLGYQEECINCDTSDYILETIESDKEIPGGIKYQPVLIANSILKSIILYDFDKSVKIYEIEIYSGDKRVDYVFMDPNKVTYKNLNDGDRNTYYMLTIRDKLGVYIKDDYEAKDITINIIGDEINSKIFVYFNRNESLTLKNLANHIYFVDDLNFNELKNKYGSIDYGFSDENDLTSESLNPYYKKELKKYHCYGEEKVILNDYVTEGENLIYDDFITKYNYYTRTKEEISDDVSIDKTSKVTKTTTKRVKTKKVSTTTTKLVGDENNGLDLEENEILQAEPLFNEITPKEKTSNIKFIVIVILLIITLQIIIFTLHRKK